MDNECEVVHDVNSIDWQNNSLSRQELQSNSNLEGGHDTVGAVCLDAHGNVAYATSTGGINAKLPGRVGDSSLIGELFASLSLQGESAFHGFF